MVSLILEDIELKKDGYLRISTSTAVLLGTYGVKSILCDELDFEIIHLFYASVHSNIVQFLGVAIQSPQLCCIYKYCSHRNLSNVLYNIQTYSLNYKYILPNYCNYCKYNEFFT